MDTILELKSISKSFGGIQALDHVDFDLKKGEVHAIVGENGAGKSTLIKIVAGAHTPDAGTISIDGKEMHFRNPMDAINSGVSVIYQETSLFPDMKVYENIFAGRLLTKGKLHLVDYEQIKKRASEILELMGSSIDIEKMPYELGIAQKQMIEIAKALSLDSKIIIMDEPTAALSNNEVDSLFRMIQRLKSKGVSIIYISHRLEEIYRVADRVTVLRDGHYIKTIATSEVSTDELITLMVDRKLEHVFPKEFFPLGDTVLEVKNLCQKGMIDDVSFSLKRRQILGVAGLAGAGRTELALLLAGFSRKTSGEIIVNGEKTVINSCNDARKYGIVYISEDRQKIGLITDMSIKDNITLPLLRDLSKFGIVNAKEERSLADKLIKALDIRTPSQNFVVSNLSGGNQQKVSVAKGLACNPDILILDEPTRGVDVGAKSEIHAHITNLAKEGLAIILISSELPEVLGMSDEILVVRKGRVAKLLSREEATQEKILSYAIGASNSEEMS